jgi:hypothetical protein
MGQGSSRSKAGKGIGGTAVADGVVALDCALRGRIPGVGDAVPGVGELTFSESGLVVKGVDGSLIATCDSSNALAARVRGCMRQGFRYTAHVTIHGSEVRIDVEPAP